MRFCSLFAGLGLASAALAAEAGTPAHLVTSVVRADTRSGRLVRTITMAPRVVKAREVKALAPAAPGAERAASSVEQFVEQTAERFQVDPLLVHSVIQVESNYNPLAVSPTGALGLMQLMPGTARRFAVKDPFNPWENIEGGVRYLHYLQTLFPDDPRLAVAAYNAGEGAVFKYGGVPPYPETTQYLSRVARKLSTAKRAAEARAPKAPAQPRVEAFVDSRGTLHLRTRSVP